MTFFPEPLKPSEGKKENDLRVNPTEADKQGKDSGGYGDPSGKQAGFYGAVLVMLKKLTSLFSKETSFAYSDDAFTSDIKDLSRLFEDLKKMDQSENLLFCKSLSEVWHRLLRHLHYIKKMKVSAPVDAEKVHVVVSDIDRYPPGQERTLGFYLTNLAGQEWLPVPFREILRLLHQDHVQKGAGSILSKWLELLSNS